MTTDATTPKPRPEWLVASIGVVMGLALGLTLGAASSWIQSSKAHAAIASMQSSYETQLDASASELAAAQATIDQWQAKTAGMSARIGVARAIDQLDQRNFGTAQSELERAGAKLALASDDVKAAGTSLTSIDLRIAEDAGTQRSALVELGNRMDAALQ